MRRRGNLKNFRTTFVARGFPDAPCRQFRNCNSLRFHRGHGGEIGLFCLRRPHFLCRQEMGERSDSGEALHRTYRFLFLIVTAQLGPEATLPRDPLPARWRVSLLRGGRFLTER